VGRGLCRTTEHRDARPLSEAGLYATSKSQSLQTGDGSDPRIRNPTR